MLITPERITQSSHVWLIHKIKAQNSTISFELFKWIPLPEYVFNKIQSGYTQDW